MSAGFQEQDHYSFYRKYCGRNDCWFTNKLSHYHCKQCNYKAAKRHSVVKHVKQHFPGESCQDVETTKEFPKSHQIEEAVGKQDERTTGEKSNAKETEQLPESLPSEVIEKEADKRKKSKKRKKKKKTAAKGTVANESQQEAAAESMSVDITDDETKSDSVLQENWTVDEWEYGQETSREYEEWSWFSYSDADEASDNVSTSINYYRPTVDDQPFDDSQYSDTLSSWDLEWEKPEKNILLINILDSLLLDIFKKAGGAKMNVTDMEEAVNTRTGNPFSFWHQFVIDCHPHGLEPYIDNDSFLFAIDELGFVLATIDLSVLASKIQISELDLSRQVFASTAHFIDKCVIVERHMLRKLILREVHLEESENTLRSPLPLPVVEIIQWFCPNLILVDITGCSDELRDIFLNQSSAVDIVDYLDPGRILDHSDAGTKIMELLEQNALSPTAQSQGWTLLHTAALLGDSQLCQYLLNSGSCDNLMYLGEITAMEIAFALHNIEVVELMFQHLQHENTNAAQFVALGLLSDHISESNILTSFLADDQLKKLKNMHNVHCNPQRLFENLCNNTDIDFKRRLLEEIVLKMHRTVSSECKAFFSCWTETTIFETVRFLCQEIHWTPEETVMGVAPYLMYVTSSPSLVCFFLKKGATANSKDSGGNTPLFYAVCRATEGSVLQSKEVCRLFLEQKADPNIRNSSCETPLLHNFTYFSKTCQLCPPNATSKCQSILPESNATRCSPEIWQFLLENKAKSKCKDEEGKSLLYFLLKAAVDDINSPSDEVAKKKSVDVVSRLSDLLCQHGATLRMRDDEGNSIIHEWAQSGLNDSHQQYATQLAEIFFDKQIIDQQNDKGEAPLHLVNSWFKVKLLIQRGANPNAKDLCSSTPLSKYVFSHDSIHFNVWKDAIKLGMDPWHESVNGDSMFRQLINSNRFSEARALVKACVKIGRPEDSTNVCDKPDSKGNTLLHIFCCTNDLNTIKYLVKHGANVYAKNRQGQIPLHLVCLELKRQSNTGTASPNIFIFLRKDNADTLIRDSDGLSCTDILESSDLKEFVELPVPTKNCNQLKWKEESLIHKGKLSEVARGQSSESVETYFYHPEPIGNGSFGLVFAAIDKKDKKEVALKRLEKQRLGANELAIKREIDCLFKLRDCEKILRYYGRADDKMFVFIVLELMDGTLKELLDKLGDNREHDMSICVDIATGLQYIHGEEVLHRDLKPNNILYRQTRNMSNIIIKIADFGLGKILDASDSETIMHSKAGCRDWMAPELKLAKGTPEHTKESDIYSCGLVMCSVLTRKSGASTDVSNCSHEAKHLLQCMLSSKPNDRPKASAILSYPMFWDDSKKRNFIVTVADEQKLVSKSHPFFDVLRNGALGKQFTGKGNGWPKQIAKIFRQMTSSGITNYDEASIIDLLLFIRNTYAHLRELTQHSRKEVVEDFIFFKKFPTLMTTVYEAVIQHGWEKKKSTIRNVLKV